MASETGSARVRSANSLALSVLEAPAPSQEKLGFFGGGEASVERNRWISQDDFRHPHLRSSPRPQDLRAQQLQESQPASKHPQGTAPGGTWLLRACVWQQGASKAWSRARRQAVAVAGSPGVQGASSPGTTAQGAGGLEGEVSGTLWREGSRYMATSRSLGTKWAAALVFLTRFPFMTRPSLSRPRYQARPD